MERLRFVCQSRIKRARSIWNDEFWSYSPLIFFREFKPINDDIVEIRAILRIVKIKTFEQIKEDQKG